jgi:hypothetical protein
MQIGLRGLFSRFGRQEPATVVLKEQVRSVNAYHAVSIVPGSQVCEPAKALQGRRFLSREAPRLPLEGCTSGSCHCHYTHHDDRRALVRRTADGRDEPQSPRYVGPERRLLSRHGRRFGD